ncbi:hypothetical protein Plhal304r1_c034g0106231 [Plasmopara halstedii]
MRKRENPRLISIFAIISNVLFIKFQVAAASSLSAKGFEGLSFHAETFDEPLCRAR